MGGNKKLKKTLGTVVAPLLRPPRARVGRWQQRRRIPLKRRICPLLSPPTTKLPTPPAKNQGRRLPLASPVGKGKGNQPPHATSAHSGMES